MDDWGGPTIISKENLDWKTRKDLDEFLKDYKNLKERVERLEEQFLQKFGLLK